MSEKKKSYIRFDSQFINDHADIANRADGLTYIGIYLSLIGLALKNNGSIFLALRANISDSVAALVNESEKTRIRKCLSILERYGYMEKRDNKELFFHEVKERMETETAAAARMRVSRKKKLEEQKRNNVTPTKKSKRNNVTQMLHKETSPNKTINNPHVRSRTYSPQESYSPTTSSPSNTERISSPTEIKKDIFLNTKEVRTGKQETAAEFFKSLESELVGRKE